MVPFWLVGEFTTPFRTYFGDWDVYWGYDLAFDPWPYETSRIPLARESAATEDLSRASQGSELPVYQGGRRRMGLGWWVACLLGRKVPKGLGEENDWGRPVQAENIYPRS